MSYAQTIAMAHDLLADGRAEDVMRMVRPLIDADADPLTADQAMLRAMLARVHGVHTGNVGRALDLLLPYESADTRARLTKSARAAVTLWLGWAHARRDDTFDEEARALDLLDHAQQLFQATYDVRGQCWTFLGQAQAYFTIDEYQFMRDALAKAEVLHRKAHDEQAERWLHDLSIAALRFNGRYGDAQVHIDALEALGRRLGHRQVQGRAAAYQAALYLDLGRSPDAIITAASRAETLLRRSAAGLGYPRLAAHHAHINALINRGAWDEAGALIQRALAESSDHPVARAHLHTLQARLLLRRGEWADAQDIVASLFERAHRLPHGLQRSHAALLRGEILARTEDYGAAAQWMERAYRNARETGHRGNQLRALLSLAGLALDRGDLARADARLARANDYDDYFRVLPFAARRYRLMGRRARADDAMQDARSYLEQALLAYTLMGNAYRAAQVRLLLTAPRLGLPAGEARALLEAATTTFDQVGATEERKTAEQRLATMGRSERTPTTRPTGSALARAAEASTTIVAETWADAVHRLLPKAWIALFRRAAPGAPWTRLCSRGPVPDAVTPPAQRSARLEAEGTTWLSLYPKVAPTICMGLGGAHADDDSWTAGHRRIQSWLPVLRLAFDRASLRTSTPPARPLGTSSSFEDRFVYQSPALERLAERADLVQSSHNPVLITGERGVGKSTLAETLHHDSERANGPWQVFDCANVPPDPLDARLFGRVTETGLQEGIIHRADGGTLFLHEIGALPLSAQEQLRRMLATGEIFPSGSDTPHTVDVRIFASASDDFGKRVRDGHFRDDLYHRLRVISLHIPPLRERREDIPLLTRHFLHTLRPAGIPMPTVTPRAMEVLLHYDWPGNVRQLRNEIERVLPLVSSEPAPTLGYEILSTTIRNETHPPTTRIDGIDAVVQPDCDLSHVLAQTETAAIERVLAECDGQITASARMLGLTRQGLYKKMKRLEIDAARFQPSDAALAGSA